MTVLQRGQGPEARVKCLEIVSGKRQAESRAQGHDRPARSSRTQESRACTEGAEGDGGTVVMRDICTPWRDIEYHGLGLNTTARVTAIFRSTPRRRPHCHL